MQEQCGTIITGDALEALRAMPDQSVQCCVTSPPYWGLRDYGVPGQLGLESTVEEHISALTKVFREARRVLRDDGTLWVNYGDTYLCNQGAGFNGNKRLPEQDRRVNVRRPAWAKPKDLLGLPWRLAIALQADGWYLRSDIIWHKPNCMPESVKDRPTRAHEYLFLLSKSERYYYDHEAVREPAAPSLKGNAKTFRGGGAYTCDGSFSNSIGKERDSHGNTPQAGSRYSFRRANSKRAQGSATHPQGTHRPDRDDTRYFGPTRARRDVWTVPTRGFPDAHFATFPPDLIRPCILAGCPAGGVVLDPFLGAGTVGVVCVEEGRHYLGVELNPDYAEMAERRVAEAVAKANCPTQCSLLQEGAE